MSKKYFGTDGIRGKADIFPMTSDFASRLGLAIAKILKKENKEKYKVIIGRDTRISGDMLETALINGLKSGGIEEILQLGVITTPAVATLTKSTQSDLGIMITASHNPYYDNGIKLFDSNGVKFPDDKEEEIETIIDNILADNLLKEGDIKKVAEIDENIYKKEYIDYIKSTFSTNSTLNGIKIVLDCANGAAYKIAPSVFRELGAEVVTIGVEPNGTNINDGCGSTKPELLQKTVMEQKADIGIALDGDADRIIVVDEKGKIVDGDKIIALIATKMVNEGSLKNNTVVVTQMSNLGLELYLKNLGLNIIRTKVGDRYVGEEMRKNGYNLGGEQSGHIILGDYSTTGDGICSGLQVLAFLQLKRKSNKNINISDLIDLYKTIPQKLENIRFDRNSVNPLELDDVKFFVEEYSKKLEGVGRILVRKSGTEPLLRVMVECVDEKMLEDVLGKICGKIREKL